LYFFRLGIPTLKGGSAPSQLRSLMSISFQQVQKYEKGTKPIGSSRLLHIAEILQVPVAFFFEDTPGGATNGASQSK
jgi:transcriptional regulator with XRE-family HTH domain